MRHAVVAENEPERFMMSQSWKSLKQRGRKMRVERCRLNKLMEGTYSSTVDRKRVNQSHSERSRSPEQSNYQRAI